MQSPNPWIPPAGSASRTSWKPTWLIVFFLIVLFFGRKAISYWVEWLWFGSLGYASVFVRSLALEWGVFLVIAAATFLYLYGAFALLKRAHGDALPVDHTIFVAGQQMTMPVRRFFRLISAAVAAVLALLSGLSLSMQWMTLALLWVAPQGGAQVVDPVFGRPLSFYFFALPAWNLLLGWLMTLAVVTCLAAALFLALSGGARAVQERRLSLSELPLGGISGALAFLLAVLAARVWLGRYAQLTEHHTIFDGVTFTGAHVTLNGAVILAAALLLGAVIAALNALVRASAGRLALAVAPAVICYVLMGLVGWYVNLFLVKPNELVRERPYIANNIAMTRAAYGVDRFELKEFPAETTVEATDFEHNQETFQNIRLWDWNALQDTLRQIQEIRTYYDFPDIDIDRYVVGGATRQVMLAARELNVNKLPVSSRNWINEKLIYTHGYGLTVNSVNGFTREGMPQLLMSNMPVQSAVPSLQVTRPEIYFGELTDADVYVMTRQKEFNYPEGDANNLSIYTGADGVRMGGMLRRALIAFDRGDLFKVPFSDDINANSRLLMRRNVRERVQALAPFLTLEQDPYIVIRDNGRLTWMLDAYTVSDAYPYATHYSMNGDNVNYVRNSVKVAVDAYDGSVSFYVFDDKDPILAAYRRLFPALFTDGAAMPGDLRRHMRYPEHLLKLQAEVYGLYHMTNPEVFYNREDLWNVATEMKSGEGGAQAAASLQPNYVMMRLPGEPHAEFVGILPFTPVNRANLIGWMAARSDGEHYGSVVAYNFPKSKLVDGPLQIEARIDQNAQLSSQLSLWNQQGSRVRRGSLLVIPSGRGLLYAESIYLQAEHSPMPELRLVVLALQDQLAFAPTFEGALAQLYGSGAGVASAPETPRASSEAQKTVAGHKPQEDLKGLIQQAARAFDDYQKLTAQGKLSEAGGKLDELKQSLNQLNRMH